MPLDDEDTPTTDTPLAPGTTIADAVTLPAIAVPPLPSTEQNLSEAEINRIHLQLSNLEMQVIYSMWPQVKNIASVCRLIDASIKAVKHQRDLLCMPYGHKGAAERKDIVFPPLPD